MKTLINSFIILIITIPGYAQYNSQLIDTTKLWSIAHQPDCLGVLYTYYIKFQGDTVIESSNYTKILKSYDEFHEDWELYGFIKEEEYKYYIRNLVGEEGLVYDFNANIGDTITINNPFGSMPIEATVSNIDSIFIEPENEFRKRITLFEYDEYWQDEYWIEGIGSLAGITESSSDLTLLTGGDNFTLFCYYKNEELLYKMNTTILCFYPLIGIPTINQIEGYISIFPNPLRTQSTIILNIAYNKNMEIEVRDIHGKLILKFQDIQTNEIILDRSQLSNGVYIISILNDNGIIARKKLLVQ